MAKEKKPLLKKWSVWYDPYSDDYYVVLTVYGLRVTLQWLSGGSKFRVWRGQCIDDEFVRMLTPLEKELL